MLNDSSSGNERRRPARSAVWRYLGVYGLFLLFWNGATASLAAEKYRIVQYNVHNDPSSTTQEANLSTVLSAIGTTNYAGTAKRLDVLAMEETDQDSAFPSASHTASVLNALYSGQGASYEFQVSTPDVSGNDRTGLVYDSSRLTLLDTHEVSSLTHKVLRGHFHPIGANSAADFYVYAIHLKASDTTADATTRFNEVTQIRADADLLGSAAVIYAGDMNVYGATEHSLPVSAYQEYLSPGNARAIDPLNLTGTWYSNPSLGNWHDNAAFLAIHTQNPRDGVGDGGMDDRFDMQLLTGELFDGQGLDYIAGSYHAFANSGTHALNGAISSGSGASPSVLAAIEAFSDHLPVVADYVVLPEPAAIVLVACALPLVCLIVRRRRPRVPFCMT